MRLGHRTGDGSFRVGVAVGQNSQPNGVFKVLAMEETAQSHRHGFLTCDIEMAFAADLVDIAQGWNVITETTTDGLFQFVFGHTARAEPVNGCGNALCSLDAFGMIVTYFGRASASSSTAGKSLNSHPMELTRIADPLPNEFAGAESGDRSHDSNLLP